MKIVEIIKNIPPVQKNLILSGVHISLIANDIIALRKIGKIPSLVRTMPGVLLSGLIIGQVVQQIIKSRTE